MTKKVEKGAPLGDRPELLVWQTPKLSRLEAEEAEANRAGLSQDAVFS